MAPRISVVLCTYNRAALLGPALESLLAQGPDAPQHELIIVDNNSTDETRAVIAHYVASSGGRMRYVFETRQGLCHARNAGIGASRAPIVAFTDDDVRAHPDWLRVLVESFAAHDSAEFIGGKVLPRWPSEPPAWLTERHWGPLALVDYGDEGFVVGGERTICLVGANVAFRRRVFEEFGGFDPRYQPVRGAVSGVDDHEFELRLYRAGRTGRYEPRAMIWADVQPNRLTKSYHRKWHLDHGVAMARMLPRGHHWTPTGYPVPLPAGARLVAGAPLYMYRALVTYAGRAARARFAGPADAAFGWECESREVLGSLRQHRAAWRNATTVADGACAPLISAYAHGAATPTSPAVPAAGDRPIPFGVAAQADSECTTAESRRTRGGNDVYGARPVAQGPSHAPR